MNKFLNYLLLAGMVTVLSCSDDSSKDDSQMPDTHDMAEENYIPPVESAFPELFTFINSQDSTFSSDGFESGFAREPDTLQAEELSTGKLGPFLPYLIFSPDSSHAIDLVSYNFVPGKRNGETVLKPGGPDTEVALIDFEKRTRQRILYLGSAGSILDARWESDSSFLVAGFEEVDINAIKPVFWRFTTSNSYVEVFNYTDTLHARVDEYAENKFNLIRN